MGPGDKIRAMIGAGPPWSERDCALSEAADACDEEYARVVRLLMVRIKRRRDIDAEARGWNQCVDELHSILKSGAGE